jgi:large subunit ribosomal protein L14
MIQPETILQVADNSGAKTVKCIKILGGYKKKYAKLGDIIVISVQELRNKARITSKVKKGEIYKALVIRTKKKIKKKDGTIIFSNKKTKNSNAAILINKKGNPIATRITEPIPYTLKKKQFLKFINLSRGLL